MKRSWEHGSILGHLDALQCQLYICSPCQNGVGLRTRSGSVPILLIFVLAEDHPLGLSTAQGLPVASTEVLLLLTLKQSSDRLILAWAILNPEKRGGQQEDGSWDRG